MLKIIGLLLLTLTTFITCLPISYGNLVDETSWANFIDPHDGGSVGHVAKSGGSSSRCPIQLQCQSLGRITSSCDAASVTVGCGACLTGFREDTGGNCQSAEKPVRSDAEADRLIDSLAAAAAPVEGDSGAELHLAVRGDEAATTASVSSPNGSVAGPVPPPPVPPAHPPPPVRRLPSGNGDYAFYVIIGTTSGLGLLLIIICAVCWYKYNFASKEADKDFGSTEYVRSSGSAGDGKLALSAQMYHYQHQKQQMLAMERSSSDLHRDISDDDSDLENDEADFTVYECPGLAPTKEMEVRNPLFKEDVEPQPPPSPEPLAPSPPESSAGAGASAAT